ncbi:GTP pyrophosphokinase [Cellulomonas iranensis]|uniref:GTP pyrophosphokinase n=1 Tax=Cellulomonas iranensis TaxID=76862 RepID=UPI000B3C7F13|nr:GTP pyrophosphokinase family protein [Cellulomonas iranensis]
MAPGTTSTQQTDATPGGLARTVRDQVVTHLEPGLGTGVITTVRDAQRELARFRMGYEFGIEEMLTKIRILRSEFRQTHDHNPIEHVTSRLKSIDSILEKTTRYGCAADPATIRERILDIAGIRITCSFVSDAYWVADMLASQPDVEVVRRKDYIAEPKANGYRSLHLIVRIPVFLSDRTEHVPVEVQIRTIAMDFWASVEHKLSYKYHGALPEDLRTELLDAAVTGAELDARMGRLRAEVRDLGAEGATGTPPGTDTRPA